MPNTCSHENFRRFVDRLPNLCARGLTTAEYCRLFKLDFDLSRAELVDSFEEFQVCCQWLASCRLDDYATHFSPSSEQIQRKIIAATGREISHGSLVAAVLYQDIPHVKHGNSPGLSIGISRFCPHYHGALQLRGGFQYVAARQ